MDKLSELIEAFKGYGYDNPLHNCSNELRLGATIKGTFYGVNICGIFATSFYCDFSKAYYGATLFLTQYDDMFMLAEDSRQNSKYLEHSCLRKIKTYNDVYKFLGIEDIHVNARSVVGYSQNDIVTMVFELDSNKNPIVCNAYSIDKKPAITIVRLDDETMHDYYIRCLKAYGNVIKRW